MDDKTRLDVIQYTLQSLKPQLSEQYNIIRIGIFGSFIKGTQTDKSDVHISVEFSDPPGLFRFMEIEAFLSDMLNAHVDLVDAKGIKPRLKTWILSEVRYV